MKNIIFNLKIDNTNINKSLLYSKIDFKIFNILKEDFELKIKVVDE